MGLQIAETFSGTGVRHDLTTADNIFVRKSVETISTDNIAITGRGTFHAVQIDGSVFGRFGAVYFQANAAEDGSNRVLVGKTGQVGAQLEAIDLSGGNNIVHNYGDVSSMFGAGVRFRTSASGTIVNKLFNFGSITTGGQAVQSDTVNLFLRNYGDISGASGVAIHLGIADDTVQNFGRIDGDVDLAEGTNVLTNRAMIAGGVIAGGSSDIVDNRGGTITGITSLGGGADVYRAGLSEERVDGGDGVDLLDFSRSSGVQIALDGSIAATGWAFGDGFLGFENVNGSLNGADVLIGDFTDNTINGNGGNDQLNGQAGTDTLSGGLGNDRLDGGIGADALYGEAGNDTLTGGADGDFLLGGDGNDRLIGGAAKDALNGGLGADTFAFARGDTAAAAATADAITDFSQTEGDRIDLSLIDARSTVSGNQAFTFVGTAAFTRVAGQLRFAQTGGDTYVQGDTNGDGTADFWIKLNGLTSLKAADFVL